MIFGYSSLFVTIGYCCWILSFLHVNANAAAIDNSVYDPVEPRIDNSEELISTIVDKCFNSNAMHCLKEKVLIYLNNVAGVEEDEVNGRAFDENVIDKVIVDRVARIMNNNEFHLQLPATFFGNSIVSYRADRGLDFALSDGEARADDLKKKLFFPILLLMKLKTKVILPILIALVGLKALKALIFSKIAIKLVLGFFIYNLIKKLGGMKMSMMPMMPQPEPMSAYGAPFASSTVSSYDPSSWEPMNGGGPYARWDSSNSASSAQNLAYNSYYPSSSSYSSNSGSSIGSSSSSGSSSSYGSSS